jgi:hypothetical protein
MIEIILSDITGVLAWAEAEDPEAALLAARTLVDDEGDQYYGSLSLSFLVDGSLLCKGLSLSQLSGPLALIPAVA